MADMHEVTETNAELQERNW